MLKSTLKDEENGTNLMPKGTVIRRNKRYKMRTMSATMTETGKLGVTLIIKRVRIMVICKQRILS